MSVDRAVLDKQLTLVADSERWSNRPELNFLATILDHNEQIVAGDTALLIESGKLAMRTWVVVVTNERLICLKGSSEGLRKVEVAIGQMKAAYTDARLGYHEVIVESAKGKIILSRLPKDAAVDLSAALNARLGLKNLQVAATRAPGVIVNLGDGEHEGEPDLPMLSDEFDGANGAGPVTRTEMDMVMQQMHQLASDLDNTKKRLAAVEDIIKRAAARSAAAKPPAN